MKYRDLSSDPRWVPREVTLNDGTTVIDIGPTLDVWEEHDRQQEDLFWAFVRGETIEVVE